MTSNPYGEFKPRRRFNLVGCLLLIIVLLVLALVILILLGPSIGHLYQNSIVTVAPQ